MFDDSFTLLHSFAKLCYQSVSLPGKLGELCYQSVSLPGKLGELWPQSVSLPGKLDELWPQSSSLPGKLHKSWPEEGGQQTPKKANMSQNHRVCAQKLARGRWATNENVPKPPCLCTKVGPRKVGNKRKSS